MYERYNYSCAESDVFYFKKIKSFKLANRHTINFIWWYGNPNIAIRMWSIGNENIDVIEKLYMYTYCKYVLHLKTSTPTCMVLGKLGRGPMILEMKIRMLRYWNKLLDPFSSKLNC